MITQKKNDFNKEDKITYTFSPKKSKFLSKFGEIKDNKKFGITKINTKINNSSINIILLDKQRKTTYLKKPSFSNLSVKSPIKNEKININKEIKSDFNNDESCEKLHNKINSFLINRKIYKKISPEDVKIDINSESLTPRIQPIYNIERYNFLETNKKNDKLYSNDNDMNKLDIEKEKEDISSSNIIITTNNINNDKDEDKSKNYLNENIKICDIMDKCNFIYDKNNKANENNKIQNLKLKLCHSFTSHPCNLEKDNESSNNNKRNIKPRKSNISQDFNIKNSFLSSINDFMKSVNDNNHNKEYNFDNLKENKRYKSIDEIKEDKNYFRLLYLSSNLIEIIKRKSNYQIGENDNYENILKKENENIISNLNNQNYYIYTNDRNVLKLTALFFQKVKKAIFLFNTEKFENAYKSLLEDKIIKNKKSFALFLLTIQGIDKEKLYKFLSENNGINNNFCILKNYLSFFNFSNQTVITSFNFLLETITIPSKNNNDLISLFTEAYINDNKKMIKNAEMGKNEIKKICGLVLKLNLIMYDPDEDKYKNKEEFINSNNDTTNWNPDLNHLISNDPSTTAGLLNYSHVCGLVFDEYVKNENSISQQKNNQRSYNELLYKKLLANNKSISFQNSLIKNEMNVDSDSYLVEIPDGKKKKISILLNNKILYKPSNKRKSIKNTDYQVKTTNEGKEEYNSLDENNINETIKSMKKGEKISKITNINGRMAKINFTLSNDENNILLTKDLCCDKKEILLIDDISDCIIGYSQNLKTNKNFENYMTIILNTEQIFEFYHPDKNLIENYVKALEYLIQKRNKVLAILSEKKKISENEISNIWQNEFLPNWTIYRKYIIKKKNKKIDNSLNIESNNNNKEKILKIWSLGLPFWLRANMWKLVIVNELNITEVLFQGYIELVSKEREIYNVKNKQNNSINCSYDAIDEYHNVIETITKDCKKIMKRINNILNEIPNKLSFKNEVFKIIRSFCLYRPDIIYSKNISEFAIFFYINCDLNEYDTFVMLCNFIITNYFFKHIQNDIFFMENQLKFFEKLIEKYLPSIHLHFKELQFNTNIFFYKWIEFLFLKTFNYKICLRIFDNFIIKGPIFIFEISIATLYLLRKEILNSDESGLVYLLKKDIININEEALFEYINSLNIEKEYNEYYNIFNLGKEKGDLLQDL